MSITEEIESVMDKFETMRNMCLLQMDTKHADICQKVVNSLRSAYIDAIVEEVIPDDQN